MQFYNEALTQLNLLNSKKATSVDEDCLNFLFSLLQKSLTACRHQSDSSETNTPIHDNDLESDVDSVANELDYLKLLSRQKGESEMNENASEFSKKFPFSKIYD